MDEVHPFWRFIDQKIAVLSLIIVLITINTVIFGRFRRVQEPEPAPEGAPTETEMPSWVRNLICLVVVLLWGITLLACVTMWKTLPPGNAFAALVAHPLINLLAPLGGLAFYSFVMMWDRPGVPTPIPTEDRVFAAVILSSAAVCCVVMVVYLLNPLMTLVDPVGFSITKKLTGGAFLGFCIAMLRNERERRQVVVEG